MINDRTLRRRPKSAEMNVLLVMRRKTSFDETTAAANKGLSAFRVECAALRLCRDKVPIGLKFLEFEFGESQKAVGVRTTVGV